MSDARNDQQRHWADCRVTAWSSAVRIALGHKSLMCFRAAYAVLLAPLITLAIYSLIANRLMLLVFVFLSVWGFCTSSTSPTGIGMLTNVAIAVAGFAYGAIVRDSLPVFCALLPGVTWFGSCAILGVTSSYLIDVLNKSEATLHLLVDRGILQPTANDGKYDAREPEIPTS